MNRKSSGRRACRSHSPEFKAKVALAALREDKIMADLALMRRIDELLLEYLRAYDGVRAAKTDIAQFIDWYNTRRPYSSLDDQTPEHTYWALLPAMQAAA